MAKVLTEREKLLPRSWLDRRCSDAEAVRWVADAISVSVKPADAPSAFSWTLLQWVRKSEANFPLFLQMFQKLMATKHLVEESKNIGDDGRSQLELIDAIFGESDTGEVPVLFEGA